MDGGLLAGECAEVGMEDLTTSGRLAHMTKLFLTKKKDGTTTALECVQGVISHFAACHRVVHSGSPVVVSGDINSPGPELKKWSLNDSWAQPLDDLLTENQPFNNLLGQGDRQTRSRVSGHVAD